MHEHIEYVLLILSSVIPIVLNEYNCDKSVNRFKPFGIIGNSLNCELQMQKIS